MYNTYNITILAYYYEGIHDFCSFITVYIKANYIPPWPVYSRPESMSHDHVCVKAEGSIDTDLGVVTTEEGGQPATLSSVHQQEHHVMVLDQLLQSLHLLGHLV